MLPNESRLPSLKDKIVAKALTNEELKKEVDRLNKDVKKAKGRKKLGKKNK